MWKSFFYYSKSERRAFVALLFLTLLLVGGIIWMPDRWPVSKKDFVQVDSAEIQHFLDGVKNHETEYKRNFSIYQKPQPILVDFDPNTADSSLFVQLGLPSYVARNILKYRQKGGVFRSPESFSRIYGIDDDQYKKLKPYIKIAVKEEIRHDTVHQKVLTIDTLRVQKYPEGTLIDVAVADTSELKRIPGIGSGIAKAIVAYRHRLGGFYDASQLKEIKYVTPEMMKWFAVKTDTICKLPINRAGLDRLRMHPYINFYQAKVIIEYRRKRGKIKNLSQLSLYEEFTEKDLKRLAYYFSFD